MQTVLIIDDDQMIRKTIGDKLESAGFGVLEAGNGEEALRIATLQQIDLILLDLLMPGMHGTDVLNRLQSTGKGTIPVIILTNVETSAVQEGIVDYLIKSDISLDEIVNRVKHHLGTLAPK